MILNLFFHTGFDESSLRVCCSGEMSLIPFVLFADIEDCNVGVQFNSGIHSLNVGFADRLFGVDQQVSRIRSHRLLNLHHSSSGWAEIGGLYRIRAKWESRDRPISLFPRGVLVCLLPPRIATYSKRIERLLHLSMKSAKIVFAGIRGRPYG